MDRTHLPVLKLNLINPYDLIREVVVYTVPFTPVDFPGSGYYLWSRPLDISPYMIVAWLLDRQGRPQRDIKS